ncbi:MAG: LysR family transcriptional regulator [Firmicutes bacterium]|nr:LysR family transcriptional regulator [[Eubacterium] siraeum]MCM1487248.1 LysR family transcriptional regulator [Bacillota bacterium]
MNLTHLSYILEIAKTGSITKAAQNLYMGQPNLSKAVRDMEKAMGTAIFKRTSKGVEPTKKGQELIDRAKLLLEQTTEFEEYFFGKKEHTRLWIAAAGADYYFSEFQRTVLTHKDSEKFSFGYFNCHCEDALELVAEGSADYAVIRSYENKDKFIARIKEKGLTPKLISEGRVQIAVNERDLLASKQEITEEDLKSYTEILTFGSSGERREKSVTLSSSDYGCKLLVQLKSSFMRVSSLDTDCLLKGIEVKDYLPESYCCDWIVSVVE